MVLSSENCPDNRQGSVLVYNNRPILLYSIYYVNVGFHLCILEEARHVA
jgi:hypothetical protein